MGRRNGLEVARSACVARCKEPSLGKAAMSGSLCWLRAASLLRGAPLRWGARPLSQAAAGGGEGGRGSRESVERLVRAHPVVVFMKGNPGQPLCGFSNAVVQILRLHGVQDFQAYDVLQDADLRQGIKNYSNWPTIPQVYLNGEFVGGCDILLQMHQNGDLVEELKKLGIRSALLDAEKDQDKK